MCFSGLDPTGGAGIQADVETLFALGCHTTPIITCLTTQSTENALNVRAVDAFLMRDQALTVIADMPVHAFKIGLVCAAESIMAIHAVISEHPDIPVVLDPVFAAGGGLPERLPSGSHRYSGAGGLSQASRLSGLGACW